MFSVLQLLLCSTPPRLWEQQESKESILALGFQDRRLLWTFYFHISCFVGEPAQQSVRYKSTEYFQSNSISSAGGWRQHQHCLYLLYFFQIRVILDYIVTEYCAHTQLQVNLHTLNFSDITSLMKENVFKRCFLISLYVFRIKQDWQWQTDWTTPKPYLKVFTGGIHPGFKDRTLDLHLFFWKRAHTTCFIMWKISRYKSKSTFIAEFLHLSLNIVLETQE